MSRSKFALVKIIVDNFKSSTVAFRKQKTTKGLIIVYILFLIALLFAFLNFAPILSPFVYPLF